MIKGFSVTQVLGASGVTLSPSNVWNDAGTVFNGISFNVTDTASASTSNLLNLSVGGVTQFSVRKNGRVSFKGGVAIDENGSFFFNAASSGTRLDIGVYGSWVMAASNYAIGWSSGTPNAANLDLSLFRDAADTLAQRRGTNAQTKRIYGTYTDASNYRRVAIAMTTGGVASIAPEGAGTGASGNVLHISGLPTANPGPGILWNNGGTVEVGT